MAAKYVKGPLTGVRQCAITKTSDGDFLDFGRAFSDRKLPGVVYVSLNYVQNALSAGGWLSPAEADELRQKQKEADAVADELQQLREYRDLVHKTVAGLVPAAEPKVKIQTRTKMRAPTEAEIKRFVAEPAPPAGSTQEWISIYGRPKAPTP